MKDSNGVKKMLIYMDFQRAYLTLTFLNFVQQPSDGCALRISRYFNANFVR